MSEGEFQLYLMRPGRHEMRAAEGGQKVVPGNLVREIQDGESQRSPLPVAVKQVIGSYGNVGQIAGGQRSVRATTFDVPGDRLLHYGIHGITIGTSGIVGGPVLDNYEPPQRPPH